MINKRFITAALLLLSIMSPISAQGLKDAIGKYCLIGAAINQWQSDGQVPEGDAIIDKHFNCAVAENCMSPRHWRPPRVSSISAWPTSSSATVSSTSSRCWATA